MGKAAIIVNNPESYQSRVSEKLWTHTHTQKKEEDMHDMFSRLQFLQSRRTKPVATTGLHWSSRFMSPSSVNSVVDIILSTSVHSQPLCVLILL